MNRINLLALLVFIGGLAWLLLWSPERREDFQSKVLGWLTPVFNAEAGVAESAEVAASANLDPVALAAELKEVKEKLAVEIVNREELLVVREENDRLRDMLEFTRASRQSLVAARVIKRTSSNWWSSIVIDKGYEDGVVAGSPVRNEVGLIGKVAQVSARSSVILLITDEKCRVSARIEGTRERGILTGLRGGSEATGELRVRYLTQGVKIPAGRRVYSVGGAVFPANIFLGTVREVEDGELTSDAVIQPAVDLAEIQDVFVISSEQGGQSSPTEGQG